MILVSFFSKVILALGLFFILVIVFMQQKPFGKLPSGAHLEKIKGSPQYRSGRFQNLLETPMMAEGASYFNLMTKFMGKGVDRSPSRTLPFVKTDLTSTPADKARLVWFGHSSFLISTKSINILVDPVFSRRASPVQYAGMKSYEGTNEYGAADMPEIDLLLISHDHYDHLDYNTIIQLKEKVKRFCVPLGVGEHLRHWGVDASKITELDWWQISEETAGVKVIATPARHFSGRGFVNNKTLWASFVLKFPAYNIFVGGDSGYDNSFAEIGKKYGPFDVALLECGQYDKQWPFIHMMPEEVVQASIDLRAEVLMPVHWSKFTLALHPWKEPVTRLLKEARVKNVTTTTPVIGEAVWLKNSYPATEWWRDY
jgi:L-ascorbate metabolism protein UlaG (beta-lactamase superfamily)